MDAKECLVAKGSVLNKIHDDILEKVVVANQKRRKYILTSEDVWTLLVKAMTNRGGLFLHCGGVTGQGQAGTPRFHATTVLAIHVSNSNLIHWMATTIRDAEEVGDVVVIMDMATSQPNSTVTVPDFDAVDWGVAADAAEELGDQAKADRWRWVANKLSNSSDRQMRPVYEMYGAKNDH